MTSKNQWRNSFWGLVSAVTDIVCGLYTSRLLLNTFGAQAHGLVNSISNFLGLILAVEFAFIHSGRKYYYRHLEQNQPDNLSVAYHSHQRRLYLILTVAALSTAVISLIYPLFFLNQFTYWDTVLLVFALGLYLLIKASTRVKTSLLIANYHNYVIKMLSTFTTLLTTILCYLFVRWGYSLTSIKIMVSAILLIHPIFYLFFIHTHYHLPKTIGSLPSIHNQPFIIGQNIIKIILSHTDILILTIAATLTDVSVYAVYAMVGKYLAHCVNAVFDGREAIYGRAFVKGDCQTAKKTYNNTQFYLANILAIIFGIAIIMLNPFVQLYTKFVKGVNYGQFWFGFFLLLAQMFNCIRYAQTKYIYAAGQIKHRRLLFDAIIEALINFVVSLVLIFPLGIIGVAIGTAVSAAYSVIRLFDYRRRYVIKASLFNALRRYLPTILIITIATFTAVNHPPHPTNKFTWLLDGIIVGIILLLLDFVLNAIFNPKRIKRLVNFICKAIATSWQRGFVRATRAYFRHKRDIEFETTHQDMADIPYLTALGKIVLGQEINFANPQTLNEKINWLKIYHYREIYTTMSDKAAVKDFVAKELGANYIIPTYGVWDSFDEIDWKSLPQSFVLKCTHDSNSVYFVRDKYQVNLDDVRKHFDRYLNIPYWRKKRETAYRDVKPRIIAERYLPSLNRRDAVEYKFTCFNGKVVFGTICQGFAHGANRRRTNDFYTPDFQHLPWRAWYRNARRRPEKPAQWDEMIAISEKFAKDIPYLRVDLYVEDGQIYFGEFTFYTGGGFIEFYPRQTDLLLGQQLTLPAPMTPRPDEPTTTPKTTKTIKQPNPNSSTTAANNLDDNAKIDYDDADDDE